MLVLSKQGAAAIEVEARKWRRESGSGFRAQSREAMGTTPTISKTDIYIQRQHRVRRPVVIIVY
jgi:hypothetical protein